MVVVILASIIEVGRPQNTSGGTQRGMVVATRGRLGLLWGHLTRVVVVVNRGL